MSLRFSGRKIRTGDFQWSLEAHDGTTRVVVFASQEAIAIHGISAVQTTANRKYEEGLYEIDGRLIVSESDF